jgi:hypothetical protein
MKTCLICRNPAEFPKCRIVGGRIVEMCVAKVHDRYVNPASNAGAFLAAAKRSFRKAKVVRERG